MRKKKKTSGSQARPGFLMRMIYKLKSPAGMVLGALLILAGGVLAVKNDKFRETVEKIGDKMPNKD